MSHQVERKRAVYVVDDDLQVRDVLSLAMKERFGADVEIASSPQEAVEMLYARQKQADPPIDLVILDMHMPFSLEETLVDQESGVRALRAIRKVFLRPVDCNVIVFTAYPSIPNCVAAMKAGATDYISKVSMDSETPESEFGLPLLLRKCEEILFPDRCTDKRFPDEEWFDSNEHWLRRNCGGKWVAFLTPEQAATSGQQGNERDGVVMIVRDAYEDLRDLIIAHTSLLKQVPETLLISSDGDYSGVTG
jgi:CheY-like chemotaxis protein